MVETAQTIKEHASQDKVVGVTGAMLPFSIKEWMLCLEAHLLLPNSGSRYLVQWWGTFSGQMTLKKTKKRNAREDIIWNYLPIQNLEKNLL